MAHRLRFVALAAAAMCASFAHAQVLAPASEDARVSAKRPAPPNFDALATVARDKMAAPVISSPLVQSGSTVQTEPRLGVPTFLVAATPAPEVRATLAKVAKAGPVAMATEHLSRYASFYRLGGNDIANAVAEVVHDRGTGPVIVSFRQQIGGIDVFREQARVLMNRQLELVAISGFISPTGATRADVAAKSGGNAGAFVLGASDAVARALADLLGTAADARAVSAAGPAEGGYQRYTVAGDVLAEPARTKPVYFHLPGVFEPSYFVEVEAGQLHYGYVISAVDGRVLLRNNLTVDEQVSYRMYADAASPYTPFDGPVGNDWTPFPGNAPARLVPTYGQAPLVTLQNSPFSKNDPWLPAGATDLSGNNVVTYADLDAAQGYQPGGADVKGVLSAPGKADWAYDFTRDAGATATQRQAAMTHLFYTLNYMHDQFYDAGFDEAAGNAQVDNYSRGGVGGDPINAEAQDSSGVNNSNMSTPPDGGSPRLQSYIFRMSPRRIVNVTAPANIAGIKTSTYAVFGPQQYDVTAGAAAYSPADGCTAATNPADLAGKIAMINLYNCPFASKVVNAQAAGAVGVLLYGLNPPPNDTLYILGGTTATTIGVAQIDYNSALAIRNELAATHTVTIRMARHVADPMRDGGLDNQIVAHEWGHYISNRLIANALGLINNLGGGLGEGWGDFHALLMTVRATDKNSPYNANFNGAYPIAIYTSAANGGMDNDYDYGAYFGIRRMPYSTDMTKNSLTYKHITNGVALSGTAPYYFGGNGANNAEVHNTGEVWAQMLWECYAALLRDSARLTFDQANMRMREYLVAAYKMTPPSPTLLEARDALLSVAAANDPADYALFWTAFAKRGAGVNAASPDRYSSDNVGAVESFATPTGVEFVSATLTDDVTYCDYDGVLDAGETGSVTIILRNLGVTTLSQTTATVSTTSEGVTFPAGTTVNFAPSAAGQTYPGRLPIALGDVSGVQVINLHITFGDSSVEGTQSVDVPLRVNYDNRQQSSATDDVESDLSASTTGGTANYEWSRVADSALLHHWHGPDSNTVTDTWLVTPPLMVASDGSFSFTFKHRYTFEWDVSGNWDGGVIEITTDGGANWTDIGSHASVPYTGTLIASGYNPLRGRPAYTGVSAGYPAYSAVTVDLGTAYQGATVQVRFRIGSDLFGDAPGWDIDDIAFTNTTNTPFASVVAGTSTCNARSLTIESVDPATGVTIAVSPADNGGKTSGIALYNASYAPDTDVTLTAPPTAGGHAFVRWERDGIGFANAPAVTVRTDTNHTLVAVYSASPDVLRADIDLSKRVDGVDLAYLGRVFGKTCADLDVTTFLDVLWRADINLDCTFDGNDLRLLSQAFGQSRP